MPIRVLIADDHAIFRSGLKALLERTPDIEVVAEAGNGIDTLAAVAKEKVDVLVLDLSMPGCPGSQVAETVVKEHPRVRIVVLTMHEDDYYLRELLKIGARAFVLKKSPGANLLQAIRAAHRGETYVDQCLMGRMASRYAGLPVSEHSSRLELLTPRERDVCALLAYGHTNEEIGDKLCISARTVETHRANVTAKLELKTRAELVRFAIDSGLVKLG